MEWDIIHIYHFPKLFQLHKIFLFGYIFSYMYYLVTHSCMKNNTEYCIFHLGWFCTIDVVKF